MQIGLSGKAFMMSRNGLDRVMKKFRLGPGTVQVRFRVRIHTCSDSGCI